MNLIDAVIEMPNFTPFFEHRLSGVKGGTVSTLLRSRTTVAHNMSNRRY